MINDITAYQRGWNASQDWQHPQANPYPVRSLEYFAWEQGREEGGFSAWQAAIELLDIRDEK